MIKNNYINSPWVWVLVSLICLIVLFYYKFNSSQIITTQSNLELNNKLTIYYFYAEWCPHCKQFSSDWKKFTNTIKYEHPDINIQVINDCNNMTLCKQYNIIGFPTIIFKIADNKYLTYSDTLSFDQLYIYTNKLYNNI
jgi:thiol-disulfide isomerase/thioredoxin